MRTTVEFPAEVMRKAKARAAERGESLKQFLTRAVVHELGIGARPERRRVTLPLFGDPTGPRVAITSRDIDRALAADEDARILRGSRRRRAR